MRKEIWLTIVVAVVIVVVYLLAWWGYTRVLKQRALEMVDRTVAYEQDPADARLRLLVVGDSSALGVGADHPGHSLPGRVGADAPDIRIRNDAVSGLETTELAPTMPGYGDGSFDVVFMQIGGNDTIGWKSLSRTETAMRSVLTEAKRIAPTVIFTTNGNFRTTPALPLGFRWMWELQAKRQRALYRRLAYEYDAFLLDYFEPIEQARDIDWSKTHARDRFHLSSYGYERAYGVLRPLLVELGVIIDK